MNLLSRTSVLFLLIALAGVVACNAGERPAVNIPSPATDAALSPAKSQQTAVVAGGCFWGIQAVFQHVKGVISATSGYSGGAANTAEYERVSDGDTGHAESVKILRPFTNQLRGTATRLFLSCARSDAVEPAGTGYGNPIPVFDFLCQ